mmetsp:Transcript_13405/g.36853  ORF Transcript_13405/g.36853 Transcript_13405/m.36853 type:complete len:98 (-) Transcript_13405:228-521(-)
MVHWGAACVALNGDRVALLCGCAVDDSWSRKSQQLWDEVHLRAAHTPSMLGSVSDAVSTSVQVVRPSLWRDDVSCCHSFGKHEMLLCACVQVRFAMS